MKMKKNGQKLAVITGASRGIGRAVARKLSRENWRVVLIARDKWRLRQAAEESGKGCAYFPVDLKNEKEVGTVFKKIYNKFGRIDVLVNNAAVQIFKKFDDTDIGEFDDMFGTNVRGAFLCAKESLRFMEKQGSGQIVNIASACFQRLQAGSSVYAASKAAFSAMFSQLNLESREMNVKVATIYPSKVATEWRTKKTNFDSRESMLLPENIADLVSMVLNQGGTSNISEIVVNNGRAARGPSPRFGKSGTALGIGFSRGIGKALALKLDQNGFKVIITGRNKKVLRRTLENFSSRTIALPLDSTKRSEVERLVKRVVAKFGRIDFLVYCVGGGGSDFRPVSEIPPADFEGVFRSNLFGAYYAVSAALPYFRKQKSGHILLISSPRAQGFSSYAVPYLAAKTALNKLAFGFYQDLMKHGVKVSVISPSFVLTESIKRRIKEKKLPRYFSQKILTLREVADIFWALVSQPGDANVTEIIVDSMLPAEQFSNLLD